MQPAVLVWLLCQIVQNGGGGGGAVQISNGHYGGVAPVNPPANPALANATYDLDAGNTIWLWDTGNLVWL